MSCWYLEPLQRSLDLLQRHLPLGMAWESFRLAGKTAYKLLSAISESYEDAWEALCALPTEIDPRTTTDLIVEWETAVGLPDPCLPVATTLEERRAWVMWRLDKRRWSTAADWHELAALFGLVIRITPGWLVQKPSLYPSCYPIYYRNFPLLGRFRVYIDVEDGCGEEGYAYSYPAVYGTGDRCAALKCLIERVKPANVVVIWNANEPICGCNDTFAREFADEFC